MKKTHKYLLFAVVGLILLYSASGFGKKARTACLSDDIVVTITIRPGRATILNFPVKPKKVVLGSRAFDIQYIENDLAITALKEPIESNLFVYLEGRRYGFELKTSTHGSYDEVVIIKDDDRGETVKVRIVDE